MLIAGANGFIGRHLAAALEQAGYRVLRGVRRLPPAASVASAEADSADTHYPGYIQLDYAHPDPAWHTVLAEVDVVINAAGILRESRHQDFATLHASGPQALFEACVKAGVKLIIQFSALGADEEAASAYHLSKKAADDYLRQQRIPSFILQPSLVFGLQGSSTRLFMRMACLPCLALPDAGEQAIQPVHMHDIERLVLQLIQETPQEAVTIPVVGPVPLRFSTYLASLRQQMGLGRLRMFRLPEWLAQVLARLGNHVPGSAFSTETLAMLRRGSTANPQAMLAHVTTLMPVSAFIPPDLAPYARTTALLAWLLPMLRCSIALVWIITGIISLGLYPPAESYALLQQVGVNAALTPWALYCAAGLDILLGLAVLLWPRLSWVWLAQIALIGAYTAILTWKIPAFWLHPFGPLLKNLPMLAVIILLWQLEGKHGIPRR